MKILRTGLILATALTLTACGFKPMHAPTAFGGTGVSMKNIRVEMQANDKINFLLAQALRDRMGDNRATPYILRITPESRRKSLGIGADDVASRYDLVMDAEFELVDAKTGDIVYRSEVRAISTYGAPRDPYGTVAAQANAEEQVASEAADRIIARLASYQASSEAK
ncbi:MAG: LPS assembly lipoprotein LptE [Robiginitomaculum sp.]|nr:LPS assembly lipoprotein LptE [Robiginitomaculum sp.]